ncbi:MAG TPA: Dabb family protein [Pseudolysinimonas sp.]|jgi:hypothetical protein
MIRHIVAFRLSSADPAERARQSVGIHDRLTSLVGVVPGLLRMDVAPDLGVVDSHFHLVLVSEHDDAPALAGYQAHPAHVEASAWVGQFVAERAIVDYER